jgi:hypothetical protein
VSRDFDQLVESEGLEPEDMRRLRRIHDLLIAAGPPAELPTNLHRPPAELERDRIVALPFRRGREAAILLVAAAVAAACFGGGYALAHQRHQSSAIHVIRVVSLQGMQNSPASLASASLKVGSADADGNWPVELKVSDLSEPVDTRYYLMIWENGKPTTICGIFRVGKDGAATVAFNVPYDVTKSTRWVVTERTAQMRFPGHVVMTTA